MGFLVGWMVMLGGEGLVFEGGSAVLQDVGGVLPF
jgi:hypothetical protein